MFYEDLSVKHLHRIFQVGQRQPTHLGSRHQHIPDHLHHGSAHKFQKRLSQKLHVLMDM